MLAFMPRRQASSSDSVKKASAVGSEALRYSARPRLKVSIDDAVTVVEQAGNLQGLVQVYGAASSSPVDSSQ